jgi:hypothetical protein
LHALIVAYSLFGLHSFTLSCFTHTLQGAQTTYLTLLKPVLANVNSRAVAPTTTATATDALHQE